MSSMPMMHVLLEGQTEDVVVKNTFRQPWCDQGWLPSTSILKSRPAARGRPAKRGGVTSWTKMEREIRLLLRNPRFRLVTTMVDYYGLPADAPGMSSRPNGTAEERVAHVEAAMASHIDDPRFLPHLVLHELETWVYAAASHLGELSGLPALAAVLEKEALGAGGPEAVNEGIDTAPSKRLLKHWPGYNKTTDGPLAIDQLGLDGLRARCPHLDAWLAEIERRSGGGRLHSADGA